MRKAHFSGLLFLSSLFLIAARAPGPGTGSSRTADPASTGAPAAQAYPVKRAALPAEWSVPETASNTAAFSQTPVAALDGNGNVYICWDEWYGELGDRRDIMFNTNASGSWNSQRAHTLEYNLINEVGFHEVAATRDGYRVVYAWMDRDVAREQMVIDWDERVGGTWAGLRWISNQAAGSSRRVTVAASPVDDTIGLVWEQDAPSGGVNVIYQYRDSATGQMSAPAFIFPGQDGVQLLPNICLDGRGTAHVVYYSGLTEAVVWYSRNSNPKNLAGWTTPIPLSGGTGKSRVLPKVAASDDGDAYVVWSERHGGNEEIYLRFQAAGVWQPAAPITQTPLYSEYPWIAVNPATEDVYVSWSETPDDVTANIMVKTFETNPATGTRAWSADYVVDTNNASEQSCIRANAAGDVHLVFAEGGEIWHVQRLSSRLAAVQAPAVVSVVSRARSHPRKANVVSFAKNPANDDAVIREYRLYARRLEDPDAAFAVLATFAPTAPLRDVHGDLDAGQRYAYRVGVVDNNGREALSGVTVSD